MAYVTLKRTTAPVAPVPPVADLPQGTIFINASMSADHPSTYIRLDKGVASLNGGYFWPNEVLAREFKNERSNCYRALYPNETIVIEG